MKHYELQNGLEYGKMGLPRASEQHLNVDCGLLWFVVPALVLGGFVVSWIGLASRLLVNVVR